MPISLVIALVLAFGVPWDTAPLPTPWPLVVLGLAVLVQFASSRAMGWAIARRMSGLGLGSPRGRSWWVRGLRGLSVLSLLLYLLLLVEVGWFEFVKTKLGIDGVPLLGEVLVLAPFLLIQLAGWLGQSVLDQTLAQSLGGAGLLRSRLSSVMLRARQAWGLVLPSALIYAIGFEVISAFTPNAFESPTTQLLSVALLGSIVLMAAPLFVRLAWPTRSLPPGLLRGRLEATARRLGFRFNDILIWDTGHTLLNAGVTGTLPWFRYVLLTDALIEALEEDQVAAVFGHEVGHVAHRHLAYFGFLCLGSLGLLALLAQALSTFGVATLDQVPAGWMRDGLAGVLDAGIALGFLGIYFFTVIGFLSRRFERQADVYGCRSLVDIKKTVETTAVGPGEMVVVHAAPSDDTLSLRSVQTFTSALVRVAIINGLEPSARSWRHGSIARRIAFLESLAGRPDALMAFDRRMRRLRLAVATALLACLAIATATGALDHL
jgi:STE24 endopeptidase